MSTAKFTREELIAQLDQACRNNGNINVLLVQAIAQHIGLSASEFECCSYIQDHGPFTAGELAKKCRITTGGMTGMIDRLERAGFVKRTPDPNDRRRVLVSSVKNEKAIKKVMKLYQPLADSFIQAVSSYSSEELAIIVSFMRLANDVMGKAIDTVPRPGEAK